ncbi:MAG: peptidylprolyl isomerase [Bacteroidales bacterium]
MKTKILGIIISTALILTSCGNNSQKKSNKEKKASKTEESQIKKNKNMNKTLAFNVDSLPEEPIFDIKTTEGDIKIKLYKDTPLHKANFIKLASERFYDGILFHRVINGFMIQTGDPLTKDLNNANRFGTGGPGYTIPAEILANHKHIKGALAAARRGDAANPKRESSGSQFYLVQNAATCAQLDGQYTVFGETVEGLDIIDKIASVETDGRDRPTKDIKIISILPVLPSNK